MESSKSARPQHWQISDTHCHRLHTFYFKTHKQKHKVQRGHQDLCLNLLTFQDSFRIFCPHSLENLNKRTCFFFTDIVYVHCREEGCIGKYIPRRPRDFPRAGILHPEAREIARGRSLRAISRAEAVYVHSLSISREVLILWCVFHLKLQRSPSQCIGLQ